MTSKLTTFLKASRLLLLQQEGNSNRHSANSTKSTDTTSTMMTEVDSPTLTGVVSVYWETREGSAKAGRDFQYCVGKLVRNKAIHHCTRYKACLETKCILSNLTYCVQSLQSLRDLCTVCFVLVYWTLSPEGS